MTILLVNKWNSTKVAVKMYFTTGKNHEEINKAFNKLH